MSTDEQQWLLQLRDGDRAAFRAIYERYSGDLLAFAYRKTKSTSVAEDLVQDLFLTLWNRRQSTLIGQSLRAYLFVSLKNQLIDYLRARVTRQQYAASLTHSSASASLSTNEQLAVIEINALIGRSTNAMPGRMRQIFELSRAEGYSNEKIAHHLNLSEQTVRNQITNALKRLRLHLSDYLVSLVLLFAVS